MESLNKWLGDWQYIWFFSILFLGLIIEIVNCWLSRQEVKWAEKEFDYDKAKDDRRKRTKTTKKTTKGKDGEITEESTEISEPVNESPK